MLARKALAGTAAAPKIYVEDVFSTYLYTGNGTGNFIENGINLGNAQSSGSAYFDGTGDYLSIPSNSVFNLGTGDFTVECWVYRTGTGTGYETILGFDVTGGLLFELFGGELDYGIRATANNKSGTAVPSFQWVHLALSRQSGTVRYFQDGALTRTYTGTYATQDFTNNTAALVSSYSAGAGVFNGYISNLRLVKGTAVYTSAFTPSTSQLTAVSGTSLLLLQGSSPLVDNSGNALSVTAYGDAKAKQFGPFTGSESGEGGLVWCKSRASAYDHALYDTARGINKELYSNATSAQYTGTGTLTAFNSNGFTLGANGSANSDRSVSWTFRKAKKFFDVVTFTTSSSTNTNQRISHNLGSTPGTIIVKNTGGTSAWPVWHRSLASATDSYLTLNGTGGTSTYTNCWGTSGPTSTDFGINTNFFGTSANYVAYVFAHDAGGFGLTGSDNVISCGSWTGNATFDGSKSINLGWEPQFLLYKNVSASTDWVIEDTMRGMPVSGADGKLLYPNLSSAEVATTSQAPNATGFSLYADNSSGNTYIYIAMRRGPMKTPEAGTSIFTPTAFSGNDTSGTRSAGLNAFDLLIAKRTASSALDWVWLDKLRGLAGNKWLASNATTAEGGGDIINTINGQYTQDGINITKTSNYSYLDASGSSYVWYALKRAPKFFDTVCYTGNGTSNRAITHNLGVTPELIIVKDRSAANLGMIYTADGGNGKFLRLFAGATGDYAYTTSSSPWNNTSPTSTQFTVDGTGGYQYVNANGNDYVAWLFATLSGISKVGSYTGNGSDGLQINCGFTNGARFVIIKRTDSANDWHVFDTARGIVSGNDPYLKLNTTGVEVTTDDIVDTYSSGFIVNAFNGVNANGGTYIYLAIA